jgi:hypothetical protein
MSGKKLSDAMAALERLTQERMASMSRDEYKAYLLGLTDALEASIKEMESKGYGD